MFKEARGTEMGYSSLDSYESLGNIYISLYQQ